MKYEQTYWHKWNTNAITIDGVVKGKLYEVLCEDYGYESTPIYEEANTNNFIADLKYETVVMVVDWVKKRKKEQFWIKILTESHVGWIHSLTSEYHKFVLVQ